MWLWKLKKNVINKLYLNEKGKWCNGNTYDADNSHFVKKKSIEQPVNFLRSKTFLDLWRLLEKFMLRAFY